MRLLAALDIHFCILRKTVFRAQQLLWMVADCGSDDNHSPKQSYTVVTTLTKLPWSKTAVEPLGLRVKLPTCLPHRVELYSVLVFIAERQAGKL